MGVLAERYRAKGDGVETERERWLRLAELSADAAMNERRWVDWHRQRMAALERHAEIFDAMVIERKARAREAER